MDSEFDEAILGLGCWARLKLRSARQIWFGGSPACFVLLHVFKLGRIYPRSNPSGSSSEERTSLPDGERFARRTMRRARASRGRRGQNRLYFRRLQRRRQACVCNLTHRIADDLDPHAWLANVLTHLPDHPPKAHARTQAPELATSARPSRRWSAISFKMT